MIYWRPPVPVSWSRQPRLTSCLTLKYFGIFSPTFICPSFPNTFFLPRSRRRWSALSLDISPMLFRRTFSFSISLREIEVMRPLVVAELGFSRAFSSSVSSTNMQEILSLTDSCKCSLDFFLTRPFQVINLAGQVGLK